MQTSMHARKHSYIHTYIHTYIHGCIQQTYIHATIHACMRLLAHICTHASIYICPCTQAKTTKHLRACTHMCILTHQKTNKQVDTDTYLQWMEWVGGCVWVGAWVDGWVCVCMCNVCIYVCLLVSMYAFYASVYTYTNSLKKAQTRMLVLHNGACGRLGRRTKLPSNHSEIIPGL